MPYEITRHGSKWAVITKGKPSHMHGEHPTKEAAMAQMRALYAATPYEVHKSGDEYHVTETGNPEKVVGRHKSQADAEAQARSLNAAARRKYANRVAKKSADMMMPAMGGHVPYVVIPTEDGKYRVANRDDPEESLGEYDTEAEAMARLFDLMAADVRAGRMPMMAGDAGHMAEMAGAAKSIEDDTPGELWVYDGDAIKTLGDEGRIGGYLVRWGSPDLPDATSYKDYFTPETDLGRFVAGPLDLLYHHGLPEVKGRPNELADDVIGEASVRVDGEGLWLDGTLNLSHPPVARLWDEIKSDDAAYGLSSGAVSHRVRRERHESGAHRLVRWPIAEASITPTPGEPRTAVVALKSLAGPDEAAAAASVLDELQLCLATASEIEAKLSRFVKVGPTKLDAVRRLRDSLGRIVAAHEARRVDPAALEAAKATFARLCGRFA